MKTFLLLCFTSLFGFTPITTLSQSAKIKIEKEQRVSVSEIFELIQDKAGYNFIYSDDILDATPKIVLKKGTITVKQLLEQGLSSINYSFEFTENETIIVRKENKRKSIQEQKENSQTINVSGTVVDNASLPLPGANILEKGTTNGVTTDFDGNFSLDVSNGKAILVISYVGFKTQEVAVNGQKTLNITLQDDAAALDEVVLIGYGARSEKKVTSAVSKLNYSSVQEVANASFEQALTGQLPGVRAIESSGQPGGDSKIDIRGIGTLTAGSNPLIVLDGLPLPNGTGLSAINGNDIKSIDVLKDAASASIYGSRGANGVIIVTTNEGKTGEKPKITFSASTGVQSVANRIDFMDGYELARYQKVSLDNAWIDQGGQASDPNSLRPINYQIPSFMQPYLDNVPGLPNTDWQDEVFRSAVVNNYHFSVSQATEDYKYYVSGGYLDQEGIVIGTGFERFNLRANIEAKVSDKLTFGLNLSPSFSNSDEVISGGHHQDGLLIGINMSLPYFAARNPDGSLAQSTQITDGDTYGLRGVVNPIALATLMDNTKRNFDFFGGAYFDYEFIEGLNFKTYLGGSYLKRTHDFFRPSTTSSYRDAAPTTALGRKRSDQNENYLFENTLTYKKSFGDHSFNGLLGVSFQKENIYIENIIAEGFSNDNVRTLNAGTIVSVTTRATGNFALNETGTWESESALASLFGRVEYDYKSKYLVSASLRRDGSSRFGENSKYGWFPAVSTGWRISQEDFFKSELINELKLRASWGRTGNDNIPNYGAIPLVDQGNYVFDDTVVNTYEPSTSPNADLSWETSVTVDFGLEAEFFDSKIKIVADYYDATTSDLLLNVPTPASGGYSNSLRNFGKVSNKGFEFSISGDFNLGAVNWKPGFNISTNKNEVLQLGPGQDEISSIFLHLTKVGEPIGMLYGYKHIGLYESAADLANSANYAGAAVGNYKFEDVVPDGVINEKDRTIIGDPYPDYTFGFNNTFTYKNIDLSFLIQGAQGYDLFLNGSFTNLTPRVQASIFSDLSDNYFIAEGNPNNGAYARPTRDEVGGGFFQNSSLKVKDASYVRLRNMTIGYNFGERLLNKLPFQQARIYLSGKNLVTITDYPLYNPETNAQPNGNGVLEPGLDWSGYPVEKSISVGLKLTF